MLYQDADDKILEQDIFVDLNEAERVGSAPTCISWRRWTATRRAYPAMATGPAPGATLSPRMTI